MDLQMTTARLFRPTPSRNASTAERVRQRDVTRYSTQTYQRTSVLGACVRR